VAALNHLGKVGTPPTTTKVLVLSMQAVPVSELLKVASELRGENIATEVYFGGPNDGIRDQLSFANSRGIPIAVIIGEDEVREGKISVKDLKTGMESRKDIKDRKEFRKAGKSGQETIERANLVQTIQDLLR
jgi:histidyl-tRNA synthetase